MEEQTPVDTRTERLTALAEFFEAGAPHFKFDMTRGHSLPAGKIDEALTEHCGTGGCIAGFAFMQALDEMNHIDRGESIDCLDVCDDDAPVGMPIEVDFGQVSTLAEQYLCLEPREAERLFNPHHYHFGYMAGTITPAQAGAAVRNLIESPGIDPWGTVLR